MVSIGFKSYKLDAIFVRLRLYPWKKINMISITTIPFLLCRRLICLIFVAPPLLTVAFDHEHDLQIMSPAYVSDPNSPKIVPPEDWYVAPAIKPE